MEYDVSLFSELVDLMRTPLAYGFIISTALDFLGYGIFKAFAILNINKV